MCRVASREDPCRVAKNPPKRWDLSREKEVPFRSDFLAGTPYSILSSLTEFPTIDLKLQCSVKGLKQGHAAMMWAMTY